MRPPRKLPAGILAAAAVLTAAGCAAPEDPVLARQRQQEELYRAAALKASWIGAGAYPCPPPNVGMVCGNLGPTYAAAARQERSEEEADLRRFLRWRREHPSAPATDFR